MKNKLKKMSNTQLNTSTVLANQASDAIANQYENELLLNKIKDLQKINALYEQTNLVAEIGFWEANLITNKIYWSDTTKFIHRVKEDYVPEMSTAINFFKEGKSREKIIKCVNEAIEKNIS